MDYGLLQQAVRDSGMKMYVIAELIGITAPTLRAILNGKRDCKVSEMNMLCDILKLSPSDREKIFCSKA